MAEAFQFTPLGQGSLDLNGQLIAWNDSVKIRLASHSLLKRDGALQEPMGAEAMEFSFKCVYIGPDVTQKYQNLIQVVQRQPRGQVTHPRLGKVNVACKEVSANEDAGAAKDTIEFSISFVQDSTDSIIAVAQEPGPQQQAGQISESSTALTDEVDTLVLGRVGAVWTALVSATSSLTATAIRFADQAVVSTQADSFDPALQKMVGSIGLKLDSWLTAARATGLSDAALYGASSAARLVYGTSIGLYNTLISQKPPVTSFTVPSPMSLADVAVRLYGAGGRAKMDELRQLNPFISTPYLMPTGTAILFSAATVRQ